MNAKRTVRIGEERRQFLRTALSAAGLAIAGCAMEGATRGAQAAMGNHGHEEAEVTPGEDLMQEHGVLERILLIYDETARRIEHNEQVDLGYRELGEQFEDKEHALFGEHGFENTVAEVARLETALGIADLARFTVP